MQRLDKVGEMSCLKFNTAWRNPSLALSVTLLFVLMIDANKEQQVGIERVVLRT